MFAQKQRELLVSKDVPYRHAPPPPSPPPPPQEVKETAYKGLVRPILEYASPVWDPHGIVLLEVLEKVQNRAGRFVTDIYLQL